ncbi:MAG: DUF72 domain-containing protein [Myxococcales bacterium]|nr:DUF72 domain-containing protein [Myxococcales bacterium]MCB9716532.1 DUF72 domain-containing protein [Myxococcales bacterium]
MPKPPAGREQLPLFAAERRPALEVEPAPVSDELRALALALPPVVRLGTSTWTSPGWEGLVYARSHPPLTLARQGLRAYARHPLLRAVGLEHGGYGPLSTAGLAALAAEVPEGFAFLARADERLTRARRPEPRRPGDPPGGDEPRWLDVEHARERVVRPFVDGLGPKAGVLLFLLPTQDEAALGGRRGLPDRLHRFLQALPRGVSYAVELRNHKLATPAYAAALRDAGALHCVSVHPSMPDVRTQARELDLLDAPGLVVRWSLNPRLDYDTAHRYYQPFDALVDPDLVTRFAIAELVRAMSERGRPSLVLVGNTAEGSAPRSVEQLARAIVGT